MKNHLLCFFLLTLWFCSCTPTDEPTSAKKHPGHHHHHGQDVHSYAKPEEAVTRHLDLDLTVDFEQKVLSGKASYEINNHQNNRILFDVRELKIEKITLGDTETPTTYSLTKPQQFMGQALEIAIKPNTRKVHIYYSTSPNAAALDWIAASQTADKKHPFLFSQGQAILTRSWIPCQDSPGIRITYKARIQVPSGMMAVMSASNPQQKNESGIYEFEMKQPIPPYLLAIAAGDLEFSAIGPRTGVYAEPSVLPKGVYELADMEKMLEEAEQLYGPYLWERYDVIFLPPSFPFGGMENPRLTFATPTIIAGDRSLVSLIAHELAHSWSGNLVTNATWDDFWLNEGFTVYFERRIMEAVYGTDYAQMLALLGFQDLSASVSDLPAKDTHLKLNLKGRDPDDGMTDIAYEKGAFFLQLLENTVGRERFDDFLKTYFEKHRFQTLTTEAFVEYLKENLLEPNQVMLDIEEWIYGPGIPDNCPKVRSTRFAQVDAQINQLGRGTTPERLETKDWTTHEWLHFIRHLPEDQQKPSLAEMDQAFQFSDSGNSEILAAWFLLAIKNGYSQTILSKIEAFLVRIGRRKFLTPLYRAFKEKGQLETAREIYQKAKGNYHSVSRGTMEELLEIKSVLEQ